MDGLDLNSITALIGSQGAVSAVALLFIKKWLNGQLAEVAKIDGIGNTLIEFKKDFEHIKEKLAELKHPVSKVDQIDKTVAILETHVSAAHRRLDQLMQKNM